MKAAQLQNSKCEINKLIKTKNLTDLRVLLPFLERYMAEVLPVYQQSPDKIKIELREKNFVLNTILRLAGV